MLVTISGPVGSGKSTLGLRILDSVQALGRDGVLWKFRTLPCFRFLNRSLEKGDPSARSHVAKGQLRWTEYEPRPLTAPTALVQLARIVAFRVYQYARRNQGIVVCNRYFYDSFVHFDVKTRSARLWVGMLRRCVPEPDLAFLVVAAPHEIASRRPTYAPAYITSTCKAYGRLRSWFPALIEVSGEDHVEARQVVDEALTRALAAGMAGTAAPSSVDANRKDEHA